jgi:hypothetical protein
MFFLKVRFAQYFFAFAIWFSTFNQVCAARQVSAFTASRLAAKRYWQCKQTVMQKKN